METQHVDMDATKTMKRRGLIAGVAALVAGIVAKGASQPVQATSGTGGQGALVLASNTTDNTANIATRPTYLFNTAGGTPSLGTFIFTDAFVAASVTGAGVVGRSTSGVGIVGSSDHIYGIVGQTGTGSHFSGIYGAGAGPNTFGVIGDGTGGGGSPDGAVGVQGQGAQYSVVGKAAQTFNTIAVLGDSRSSASGGVAVQGVVQGGTPNTTGTIGVYGANLNSAPNSHGIIGLSQSGHGLVGVSNATGSLFAGLVGNAGPNGANAGNFFGNVAVTGNLFVGGSQTVAGAKSAALAHPDGSHRLVYCVEAPESWLEDVGTGTLTAGRADVKLDADFTAVADMSDYHVFLTTYGASQGVDVMSRNAAGFSVQERSKGASSVRFSWRVMAKRKDVKAGRLAKVNLPQLTPPVIAPPHVPDLPTPPAPPQRP